MEKEIWKPIKGYEGVYEISNTRKVRSLKRLNEKGRFIRGRELKLCKNGNYYVVTLYKNEKPKNFYVDKLVFLHFGI